MQVESLIIVGNSTHPDPLSRLPSSLQFIYGSSVRFVSYGLTTSDIRGQLSYAPNWTHFAATHTALVSLKLTLSGMTSIPEVLPSTLAVLHLAGNLISTQLPSTMLSNLPISLNTLDIDLSRNGIYGTIPPLFETLVGFSVKSLTLNLSNNEFGGNFPNNLLNTISVTMFLQLDVSGNSIEGTIPSNLLGPGFSNASSISIALNDNQLSGAIPSDLLISTTATNVDHWHIDISNNLLSGAIPVGLLNTASTSVTTYVSLLIQGNALKFAIPDLLQQRYTSLQTFIFRGDSNQFSSINPNFFYAGSPALGLSVSLVNNSFYAALPPDLMRNQQFSSFFLDLSYNHIAGSPFEWIALMRRSSLSLTHFEFRATHNNFDNPSVNSPFAMLVTGGAANLIVTIDLSYNQLSGTIPPNFFADCATSGLVDLSLNLAFNQLSGTLPAYLFDSAASSYGFDTVSFNVSHNLIQQPLPATLVGGAMPSSLTHLTLDYSSNNITDYSLTPALLQGDMGSMQYLKVLLDHNPLGGPIPGGIFAPVYPNFRGIFISLVNCSLSGTIPNAMLNMTAVAMAELDLSDNQLTSSKLNTSEVILRSPSRSSTVKLIASRNRLGGTLVSPEYAADPASMSSRWSFSFAENNFTSLVVPGPSFALRSLDLSNNARLSGTLSGSLFADSLEVFLAPHTLFTGVMPLMNSASSNLSILDLNGTSGIDFCSPAGKRSMFGGVAMKRCNLEQTNAASCFSAYHPYCFTQLECNPLTRPSLDFACLSGVWKTNTSVLSPVLTIPAGGVQTIIGGDIASTDIIFTGLGNVLVIQGCANNLTTITLQVSPSEIKDIPPGTSGTPLLYFNISDASCKGLGDVNLNVETQGSGCERVKAKPSTNSEGTLFALFSIDKSRCNRWWIILVSVLCAALVIAVVVVILLAMFVPAVRNCIRPYSKPRQGENLS